MRSTRSSPCVGPTNYSPDQDARFEVHFEKLRNRVGEFGQPFEAAAEPSTCDDGRCGIAWTSRDLKPPLLTEAAELFGDGHTVREVAELLGISKSEAGRLRQRAVEEGLLDSGTASQVVRLVPPSQTLGD
jgi:putative DNA primase/helicase